MITRIPLTKNFAAGSDYEEVDIRLNFGQGSGNRQCFNIVILDDMVFEGEENFTLILVPVNPPVIRTINVTVFIQDNEGKSRLQILLDINMARSS